MSRELLIMQNSFEWETKEGKTIETDKALNCKARNVEIEGQTYQNLSGVSTAESSENKFYKYEKITGIKSSTTYTWIFDIKSENTLTTGNITEIARIDLTRENGNQSIPCGFTGTVTNVFQRVKLKFNTPSANIKFIEFNLRNQFNVIDSSLTSNTITIKNNMLLEGDYTNTDLPVIINWIESVAEREVENGVYPIKLTNKGNSLLDINSPIPLRSLPKNNVRDTIENGKLIQRVGVFNASKNYSSAKWMGSMSPFLEFDFMQGSNRQNDNVYCNTLPYKTMGYNSEHNEKGFSTQVGFRIKPFEEDNKTREEYETWLKENETIIYYELVNPIVHELNIPPISIAKGGNIITTANNITPNLSMKYKKSKK